MSEIAPQTVSRNHARLTSGSVSRHLVGMAVPMAWGIFAVIAFNLADTFFVGQLGTRPLAALAFTFPVVMAIMSLALGLGIGTASVLARAMGSATDEEVRRLTTDSLVLSTLLVMVIVAIGLATINPLFSLLGADADTLPLVREYMLVWYLGTPFLVVPMIGNFAMRAAGDARFPSLLMTVGAGMNIVLDPLLIFGLGPFPSLGIQGAAVASLLARAVTLVAALAVLHYRMRLIAWTLPRWGHLLSSARQIGHVAVPAAATNVINPLAVGVVTAIVSGFGAPAVAGFGVATRIEAFAIIPLLALTAGLGPVVGQNWGANQTTRVAQALRFSAKICLIWGLLVAAVLAFAARPIVELFDSHPETISAAVTYLWIVPVSFTAYGLLICVNAALNAAGHPLSATLLMFLRTFALYVPLAWLGGALIGLDAVFAAAALSSFIVGALAWRQGLRLVVR